MIAYGDLSLLMKTPSVTGPGFNRKHGFKIFRSFLSNRNSKHGFNIEWTRGCDNKSMLWG
jgi:hypothetical protein